MIKQKLTKRILCFDLNKGEINNYSHMLSQFFDLFITSNREIKCFKKKKLTKPIRQKLR